MHVGRACVNSPDRNAQGAALENTVLCVCVCMMMMMMMMSLSEKREGDSGREWEASWLIMIDSFRAHSSFFPLALSLPLSFYGLITETYSISHYLPSSIPSSLAHFSPSFLSHHPTLSTPTPAAPVYSSVSRKGGCQSPSAASPSSNPLHPSLHPSFSSVTVTSSSLFTLFLSLSLSFLPLWRFFIYKWSLSVQRLPLFIFILFSSRLHLEWSIFPCVSVRHTHRDGKKQTHKFYFPFLLSLSPSLPVCLCVSFPLSRPQLEEQSMLTQPSLIQMLPEMHHGKPSLGLVF